MGDERGNTFLELVLALAIIASVSALATISAVGFISSARTAKDADKLADGISLARERSIGRYERWRIRFLPNPGPGSTVLKSYVLESCPLPVGASGVACTLDTDWTVQTAYTVENGTGLIVPESGGEPVRLTFDRTGLFLNTADAEIQVCRMETTSGGADICRSGAIARVVRIRKFSGIIET